MLVLCEDPALRARIVEALKPPTYLVRHIPGIGLRVPPEDWQPQLALIELEAGSARELLRQRQQDRAPMPAIVITRSTDPAMKLRAFAYGADDVLDAPFLPDELAARVSALLRRTHAKGGRPTPVLSVGTLEIDLLHRRVRMDDHELRLTALEQSLLYLLASNAGRTLSRQVILDSLWGADSPVESNVVDRHVHLLRRKLKELNKSDRLIETVPGRGYRFVSG